jgi:hypothetical protein
MNVQINYEINRDAAIKSGKNEWGKFIIEVDPLDCPAHLREELTRIGEYKFNACPIEGRWFSVTLTDRIDATKVFELLQLRAEERAHIVEEQKTRAEEEQRELEKCVARRLEKIENTIAQKPEDLNLRYLPRKIGTAFVGDIDVDLLSATAKNQLDIYLAKKEIEALEAQAATERETRLIEERETRRDLLRAKTLADAIAALADDTDRERFADGTLTDDECVTYRATWIFGDDEEKYEKITSAEFACDCNGEKTYRKAIMGKLNKSQWLQKKTLEKKFSLRRLGEIDITFVLTAYMHVGTCACGEEITHYSVLISASADNIVFASRELWLVD